MGINTEAIQKLYVAYFNRPADFSGLTYWENAIAAGSAKLSDISAQFAASNEYKAAYANMDAAHVVAQVYANLFGKTPAQIDSAGLQFWTQALLTKAMTIDNVVTSIAAGAQGADKDAYANKVAAATAFTAALDTPEKQLAYSGDAANGVAKTFIASVTDKASLDAAISTGNLGSVIADVVANAPVVVGTTYTLTAGMDTFPGTAGNDTFNVYTINPATGVTATNLSSFDTLDGSAGKDTLNIQLDGVSGNSLTGTIKNIETINITATAATPVDASIFQGATAINQIGTAGAVTNLAAGTTAGFNGKTIAGALSVGAAGSSAAVSFTNVADTASLSVSGSKLASVSISGTRTDVAPTGMADLALAVTAGKDVQTVSINTNQGTVLTLAETAGSTKHITTIDASASTGGVTYDESAAGAILAANVSTGSGKDKVTVNVATAAATAAAAAVNSTVSTGAGSDTIVVANTGTGLTTIDAGAGDDSITVTKVAGAGLSVTGGDGNDTVALSGTLETTDVIDGGAGTDVISLAGKAARVADDYIVLNKLLKNFEGIKFSTAETALDATKLAATYTSIDLAAGSAITGVGTQAITANGAVTLTADGYSTPASGTVYAGNLVVTEKAAGAVTAKADVLTLTVKATTGAADTAVTVLGDVQTAAVTLTNNVDNTTTPTADRLAILNLDTGASDAALKSLTLSGSGKAVVVNAAATALATVDASALGATLTVAGTASTGLDYTSNNAKVETIKLGSAIDKVTLNASTYGKVDTVTGLNLVMNSGGTALTATSDTLTVAGATAAVKFTTTQTDIDLALKDAVAANAGKTVVFQMGGDTYVFHDNGVAGGGLGAVDATDVLVKLTGAINLDALILALH